MFENMGKSSDIQASINLEVKHVIPSFGSKLKDNVRFVTVVFENIISFFGEIVDIYLVFASKVNITLRAL